MNKKYISSELKEVKPVKFLEALPELILGTFAEKALPSFGFSELEVNSIVNELQASIDTKINSGYNINNIILGSLIFAIGSYIATVTKNSSNKKGG